MNILRISVSLLLLLGMANFIFSQEASKWDAPPKIELSGFLDVYYAFDFNNHKLSQMQPFLFSHNRHNEFNLNLGLLKLGLNHDRYRASLAVHIGTYALDNYVLEEGLMKAIYEAYAGLALDKEGNWWLDAGVLPSHIGFESAISMDNWTLTRSILAESSPYFSTGVMLSYAPESPWYFSFVIMNGWQRIQRVEGNSLPSFGTQLKYSPTDDLSLNWSTFVGSEFPDSIRRMRYFNNVFAKFRVSDKLSCVAGFDIGLQQKAKSSSDYDSWIAPVIIFNYVINDYWSTAVRYEYYQDEFGATVPVFTENGFQTHGYSLNFDYRPNDKIAVRLEGRNFNSMDEIFAQSNGFSSNSFYLISSIAVKLENF